MGLHNAQPGARRKLRGDSCSWEKKHSEPSKFMSVNQNNKVQSNCFQETSLQPAIGNAFRTFVAQQHTSILQGEWFCFCDWCVTTALLLLLLLILGVLVQKQ